MAVPGADFVLHNSLFLVAHFHNVIIGGVVFGYFAGFVYWFPKSFGFKLNERWGKRAFWCWLVGFYFAFVPLYILGFLGMTRRMNHSDNPAWQPYLYLAVVGVVLIAIGILCQIIQLVISVRDRNLPENRDVTGDPWGGRTLEWSTSSPPPLYNFAELPVVNELDSFWAAKERGASSARAIKPYQAIHMPRNTAAGLVISAFGTVMGFGLIWHIWWLAAACLIGMIGTFIVRSFNDDIDYYVSADQVAATEGKHARAVGEYQDAYARGQALARA
jgi:cytochrome o ubiquinol oxidase subunit 1